MLLVFFFQKFQKNLKTFNPTAAFSYVHICYYFEIDIMWKIYEKYLQLLQCFYAYLTEKKSVYMVSNYNYRYLIWEKTLDDRVKSIVFYHQIEIIDLIYI